MSRTKRFWRNNRFRMLLTLELAVMLPAAALIYFNYRHLENIQHEKVVEATIHRDFQEMLAISEKKINDKAATMMEAMRKDFPCPETNTEMDTAETLDTILLNNRWLSRVFVFDAKKGFLMRSQPDQLKTDPHFREEHERMAMMYGGWLGLEHKTMAEGIRAKKRHMTWYGGMQNNRGRQVYATTVFFLVPGESPEREVIGGASFDPYYLKATFFPSIMQEIIVHKLQEEHGNPLAMTIFPSESDGYEAEKLLAASSGWREGKPEVTRNFNDVFQGLTLGLQFQGTSADALGKRWMRQSFLVLGVLSLFLVGGLALTYRSVSKEMEVAKLKSDFVSNVSHELRTPLSLIRLYAETLELGRIQSQEKVEEYYRIIRKESERLTALINNILDFSRIEAGRKEYEFRETDIAELVRNTLDSYRDQIEQQGFDFEQHIDSTLPAVQVDREAIARSLVNLVNNALKYSAKEKVLRVRLYRSNGSVKLEVADKGIGIPRNEHSKIFEKFYRVGDPLVHNTKGSGLGLSLVRHIAHAHGGEVEVESTPGKGSKFTLSLPVNAVAEPVADSAASGAKAS